MPALQLTTEELLLHLSKAQVDRNVMTSFKELFDRADLVKFAKTLPAAEQGSIDLQAARQLVTLTAMGDLAAQTPKDRA
mgnify:FL=1